MKSGALRSKVSIQKPVAASDSKGGTTVTNWVGVQDVWAEIDPTSSRRYVNADQLELLGYHTIRMRYTPKLTSSCRLVQDARVFYISSIVNTGNRDRELILTCTEEVGNVTP